MMRTYTRSDLRHHEAARDVAGMVALARQAAWTGPALPSRDAHGLQWRQLSEHQHGNDGEREHEAEHLHVDCGFRQARYIAWVDRDERPNVPATPPARARRVSSTIGNRKNPTRPDAEPAARRDLAPPRHPARQDQIAHIDAGNEPQEPDRHHEHQQNGADVTERDVAEPLQPQPPSVIRVRILPFEALGDHVRILLRLRQGDIGSRTADRAKKVRNWSATRARAPAVLQSPV